MEVVQISRLRLGEDQFIHLSKEDFRGEMGRILTQ